MKEREREMLGRDVTNQERRWLKRNNKRQANKQQKLTEKNAKEDAKEKKVKKQRKKKDFWASSLSIFHYFGNCKIATNLVGL